MLKVFTLLLYPMLVILMWAGGITALSLSLATGGWEWVTSYAVFILCLVLLFAVYKRSLKQALFSLGVWHFQAAALLLGLREEVVAPTEPIRSLELSSPPAG